MEQQHKPTDPQVLTVEGVAQLVGASVWWIQEEIKRGNLKAKKIGNVGGWRIRQVDYERWLATPTAFTPNKKAKATT